MKSQEKKKKNTDAIPTPRFIIGLQWNMANWLLSCFLSITEVYHLASLSIIEVLAHNLKFMKDFI